MRGDRVYRESGLAGGGSTTGVLMASSWCELWSLPRNTARRHLIGVVPEGSSRPSADGHPERNRQGRIESQGQRKTCPVTRLSAAHDRIRASCGGRRRPGCRAAQVQARGSAANQPVEWWRCEEVTAVDLRQGDTLILINLRDDENSLDDLDPRRRTAQPARVVKLVVSGGDIYVLYRYASERGTTTISRLRKVLPDGSFDEDKASTDRQLNRAILALFEPA